MDVPLRCSCGALRGWVRSVGARSGNRCICYCDDCQSFAHFLERADAILDAHGGTDIFQTSPARVDLTSGVERLASIQLRPGSRVVRWYASCCGTPIGNTPADPRIPFVGLIHACIDSGAIGSSADAVLGPVRGSVFRRFARGDGAALPAPRTALQVLRIARLILVARLRGDRRQSPFFDPGGKPVAAPRVLGADELRAVEASRDASVG
jgi:hypothetical protein